MKKYLVLKPFWKRSQDRNYKVGEIAEFEQQDVERLLQYGYVEEVKEPKSKAKEVTKKMIDSQKSHQHILNTKKDD